MIQISYPAHDFRLKRVGAKEYIFDALRRKWVVLQPEEWVRQHFLQYLMQVKGYPASLVAVEREIKVGELRKRFDIAVFGQDGAVRLLVECKAMDVALDEKVLQQVLAYHSALPADCVVVTNGVYCVAFGRAGSGVVMLEEVPGYG
jgi:hypothetical protein